MLLINKSASIAILGFGDEGQAMLTYFLKKGFKNITICDKKEQLENVPHNVKTILGPNYLKKLNQFEVIFRSPGISCLKEELIKAQKTGVLITSQIQYFLENCPCKVIGVTGTKGKGTTSTLIYEILKNAGYKVFLAGNIGNPPIAFLDKLTKDNLVVLELSSFQLQDLTISPHIAVILNITEDHLDYHKDTVEYRSAKEPIVRNQTSQDYVIINQDYKTSAIFGEKTPARVLKLSTRLAEEDLVAYLQDNAIILNNQKICDINEVGLIGPHNLENILAAISAISPFRIKPEIIKKTLQQFKGLPHRLEFVKEVDGIKFYNDSFSTNPDTCIAALYSFKEPLILIAGGSEKYADFNHLAEEMINRKNLKTVVLIGETAPRIEKALFDANQKATEKIAVLEKKGLDKNVCRDLFLKVIRAKNLQEAFLSIKLEAKKGDIVLLSPACASFGLFKNYKERGEVFKKMVKTF